MQNVIESIFGTYEPLTNGNGEILEGIASWNISYILGVALFAIVLISVLKMIGGLLCK